MARAALLDVIIEERKLPLPAGTRMGSDCLFL
jgi:hypothetical protein